MFRSVSTLWPRLLHEVWLNSVCASRCIPSRFRYLGLRLAGFDVARCTIQHGVEWFGSGPVEIGRGAYVNRGAVVNHSGGFRLGRGAGLGHGTVVITASHEIGPAARRWGTAYTAPVTIGDGVWVGANVTILPGVVIGPGAVVAAGAVVTKDCEADALYAGVPAKKVRTLTEDRRGGVPRSTP